MLNWPYLTVIEGWILDEDYCQFDHGDLLSLFNPITKSNFTS